jgi:hypothetical protein
MTLSVEQNMPERLRRRADALRRATVAERDALDGPPDLKLVAMMLELADELEAEAARDEAAASVALPKAS